MADRSGLPDRDRIYDYDRLIQLRCADLARRLLLAGKRLVDVALRYVAMNGG